jgi:hypothetical protein
MRMQMQMMFTVKVDVQSEGRRMTRAEGRCLYGSDLLQLLLKLRSAAATAENVEDGIAVASGGEDDAAGGTETLPMRTCPAERAPAAP